MSEWAVLGLDADPCPGDPGRTQELAGRLRGAAELAEHNTTRLRGVAAGGGDLRMQGDFAPKFLEVLGELPNQLAKLGTAFRGAEQALSGFATGLEQAKTQAGTALRQGRDADTQYQGAVRQIQALLPPDRASTVVSGRRLDESLLETVIADLDIVRYGYDDHGNLTEIINSSGQPLRFGYDADGRMTRWVDRNGTEYRYTYDQDGRCVATTGSGQCLNGTIVYDPANHRTVETNSLGHSTTYHFNPAMQVQRVVNPLGHATVSEWDRYDRLLARTDPLGRTTRYTYDQHGNLITITRPDGSQTTTDYNEQHLPTTIVGPDGTVWRRTYDERGNPVAITDPTDATTRYSYDERGCLTTSTDALGHVRRVDCNAAGLPVTITDPLGATTRCERDGFGRVIAVVDPVGGVTRYGWTVEGKLAWRTRPDGATERWTWDGEGNLIEHFDALGQLTRTEIGHFDLPVTRTTPNGARLAFSYNTELQLTSVTNPQGLVWRYDYDPAGNLIRETDFNNRVLTYAHDAAGQLVERTNGAGDTTRYTHDLLGNITKQHCGGVVSTFAYDTAGRMVRATNPDADLRLERDPLGRVLAETCNGRTITSSYDALGRRVHRRTPTGAVSTWDYDPNHQPAALHTAGRTLRFDHDPAGRETARYLDTGAVLTQTWDPNHQLRSQTLTTTGSAPSPPASAREARLVQRRTYDYRPDGYLSSIDDQLSGQRRFDLDTLGRVTTVHGAGWTENYSYDPAGNLTHATWPLFPRTDGPSTDAQGERQYTGTLIRQAGNVRFKHDAQGRVTLRQHKPPSAKPRNWHYTWDPDDQLTAITTPDGARWRYRYDPLGRRIAKQRIADDGGSVLEQTDFTWDGTVLAEQTHAGSDLPGARTTTWNWEPGTFRPVSQTERAPLRETPQEWIDQQFYAIVTDLIGTPTELIDPDGTITWHPHTTLWGTVVSPGAGRASTPLRFPGQYHDPETELNYNYFRYYNPTIARYETNDPLSLHGGSNPSSYVPNPTTWVDPLGLAPGYPKPAESIAPSSIRFSQSSVNGAADIAQSMKPSGWVGDPIDVVRMSDNGLTTVDNTRVLALSKRSRESSYCDLR